LYNVTPKEARILFEKFQLRRTYGKVICRYCQNDLCQLAHDEKEKLDPESEADSSEDEHESDLEYSYEDEEVLLRKKEILQNLLKTCQSDTKVWQALDYHKLSEQSQTKFLSRTRSIIRSVLSICAPNNTDDVYTELMNESESNDTCVLDDKFCSVMKGVAQAYYNAQSCPARRAVLSTVAAKVAGSGLFRGQR
jgi:hypothetical protein